MQKPGYRDVKSQLNSAAPQRQIQSSAQFPTFSQSDSVREAPTESAKVPTTPTPTPPAVRKQSSTIATANEPAKQLSGTSSAEASTIPPKVISTPAATPPATRRDSVPADSKQPANNVPATTAVTATPPVQRKDPPLPPSIVISTPSEPINATPAPSVQSSAAEAAVAAPQEHAFFDPREDTEIYQQVKVNKRQPVPESTIASTLSSTEDFGTSSGPIVVREMPDLPPPFKNPIQNTLMTSVTVSVTMLSQQYANLARNRQSSLKWRAMS